MSRRLQLIDDLSYEDVKKCYRGSVSKTCPRTEQQEVQRSRDDSRSPAGVSMGTGVCLCGCFVSRIHVSGQKSSGDHQEAAAALIPNISLGLSVSLMF